MSSEAGGENAPGQIDQQEPTPSSGSSLRSAWSNSPTALILLWMALTFPYWSNVFVSPPDSASYLSVARTLVIGRELDFSDDYAAFQFQKYLVYLTGLDRLSMDWPIGSGVVWAPAYATAHATVASAHAVGIDAPWLDALGVSGLHRQVVNLFVLFLAIVALRIGIAMAEPYAGRTAALGAALVVVLGTPVGFYIYMYSLMSHITSMAAIAVLLYGWHATRRPETGRTLGEWALLGLAAGVMTMIRPQNAVFLVIFLAELFLEPPRDAAARRSWLLGVPLAALTTLAGLGPQLIIWGHLYGNPLQLPKIEEMHWFSPNLFETLFSDYHGLLTWSPVLVLAPVGLLLLWPRDRTMAAALAAIMALQLYLNAANEVWWAGGSFGNRRFSDIGVPFLIAIAVALRHIRPAFVVPLAAVLTAWNFLLMAMERGGRLTLDHYVPFNRRFFASMGEFLQRGELPAALVGDFAGFAWPWRVALAALLSLAALAFWLRPLAPARRKATIRVAVLGAAAWFTIAPVYVGYLAISTVHPNHLLLNPDLPRSNRSLFNSYYEYGFYLYNRKRFDEALVAYRKAADLRPDYANPYRYLATVHIELGEYAKALDYAERALDRRPDYGSAFEEFRRAAEGLARSGTLLPSELRELRIRFDQRAEAFTRATQPE